MNVLILNTSPRKGGNGEILCGQFAKGAGEAGHSVTQIDLRGKSIAPCRGCGACQQNHACVIRDDMAPILDAMIAADVIVLSVPVYFYSPAAQLKLLIDRTYANFRGLKNKRLYYIITAADPQHEAAEGTLAVLHGFARCLPGAEECGVIYGTGTWDIGDAYRHPAFEKAYEMGKEV